MKISFLLLILLAGPMAWGQGRAPDKKPAESKPPSHPVKTAKDQANDALDHVDSGVHEAGSTLKKGANDALDAVDQGVHKVVGSSSK